MSEQRTAFDKWFDDYEHNNDIRLAINYGAYEIAGDAWQSATAEAKKRIESLEGEVAGLRFECASKDLHTDTLLEQLEEARISNTELQANNNDLREASQALIDRWDTPKWKDAEHTAIFINALRNALSATPAAAYR